MSAVTAGVLALLAHAFLVVTRTTATGDGATRDAAACPASSASSR